MRVGVLCLSLLLACGGSEQQEKEPTPSDPRHEALQADLEAFDAGSPGAILVVTSPDFGPFAGSAGWSVEHAEVAMQPDDLFGIASITKSFTAAVVLELRDEGKLSLDSTLAEVCPSCPFGDKTIEQLLRHRSGITDVIRPLIENHPTEVGRPYTPQELLEGAEDTGNDDYLYSNTNYLLLGLVVEDVTGSTWEAEVRARLLDPLGLENTYLPTVEEVPEVAHGFYGPLDVTAAEAVHPSIGWSAGSMISSAQDVATWLRLLLEGEAVSAQVLAAMTESDGTYGRGLKVKDSLLGPATKIGHDGLSEYTSEAYCVLEVGACVVAMANRFEADASGVAALAWDRVLAP
jgi:CubicO group peptidase (beta-lactamase class C family)